MHQITEYELELMKIIWANGNKALYADIAKALEDRGTPWTKNTIITLSSRLIAKGNEYIAIVSESSYQTAQAETFLEKIYEGNAKGLVSTLIEKDLLSAEDMEDLRRYWEGGESGK